MRLVVPHFNPLGLSCGSEWFRIGPFLPIGGSQVLVRCVECAAEGLLEAESNVFEVLHGKTVGPAAQRGARLPPS